MPPLETTCSASRCRSSGPIPQPRVVIENAGGSVLREFPGGKNLLDGDVLVVVLHLGND
jgi:hypothetical protein